MRYLNARKLWRRTLTNTKERVLEATSLETGYGKKRVVCGVDVLVSTGEIVGVIGHNGAGKSTLLKALFGLLPLWKGEVFIRGMSIPHMVPRRLIREGMSYVAQGSQVFADLSVWENLALGWSGRWSDQSFNEHLAYVLEIFPSLKTRMKQRAGTLSGGEKQTLALGSALLSRPTVLLLDEPSLGLSPTLVRSALEHIEMLNREHGISVLIVEQKVREVLRIASRVYVLRNGEVSFAGDVTDLHDNGRLRDVYL